MQKKHSTSHVYKNRLPRSLNFLILWIRKKKLARDFNVPKKDKRNLYTFCLISLCMRVLFPSIAYRIGLPGAHTWINEKFLLIDNRNHIRLHSIYLFFHLLRALAIRKMKMQISWLTIELFNFLYYFCFFFVQQTCQKIIQCFDEHVRVFLRLFFQMMRKLCAWTQSWMIKNSMNFLCCCKKDELSVSLYMEKIRILKVFLMSFIAKLTCFGHFVT